MGGSHPSRTAVKIARFLILLDADPRLRPVLPPDTAALSEAILRGSGVVPSWQIDMMRKRWARRMQQSAEAISGRGQVLWYGLRKRWIADQVTSRLEAGADQLLVLGAGFDTLGTAVASRHPGALVIETDEPATADPKRAALAASRLAAPNQHVISGDLGQTELPEVLATTPWRTDAPSVVVAEGLLMYLRPVEVERLFTGLHASVGPGSTLLCTSVFTRSDGGPRVAAGWLDRPIRWSLKVAGEPMHLGLDPADVPEFFAHHGATVAQQPTLDTLRRDYLTPIGLDREPVTGYEHLIAAELNPLP